MTNNDIQEKINEYQSKLKQYENEKQALEKQMIILEEQYRQHKEKIITAFGTDDIDKLKEIVISYETEIKNLEEELNAPHTDSSK
jgi:predicted transcriptional regulator